MLRALRADDATRRLDATAAQLDTHRLHPRNVVRPPRQNRGPVRCWARRRPRGIGDWDAHVSTLSDEPPPGSKGAVNRALRVADDYGERGDRHTTGACPRHQDAVAGR
ncbi:hypothetical protein EBESD8_48820 [Rhodococcus aetherivorans]|nr:hypothetical protein EBESD8_48820 [Rhodococcus aetherivorans]